MNLRPDFVLKPVLKGGLQQTLGINLSYKWRAPLYLTGWIGWKISCFQENAHKFICMRCHFTVAKNLAKNGFQLDTKNKLFVNWWMKWSSGLVPDAHFLFWKRGCLIFVKIQIFWTRLQCIEQRDIVRVWYGLFKKSPNTMRNNSRPLSWGHLALYWCNGRLNYSCCRGWTRLEVTSRFYYKYKIVVK